MCDRGACRITLKPSQQKETSMNKHLVHSLRRLTVASLALAGLGSAMVLVTPKSAEAKTCVQKYRDCNSRCAARSVDHNWQNCIYRTCNPQYDRCAAPSFATGKAMTPKNASSTTQQPSGNAGKTAPGTDRPGKNGGFGQGGPIRMSAPRRR
jgi:hypothetical protein